MDNFAESFIGPNAVYIFDLLATTESVNKDLLYITLTKKNHEV
jgi:hypothetical protein